MCLCTAGHFEWMLKAKCGGGGGGGESFVGPHSMSNIHFLKSLSLFIALCQVRIILTIKVEQVNNRLNSTSQFATTVGVAFILFCVLWLSLQKQVACNQSNTTKLHYLGRILSLGKKKKGFRRFSSSNDFSKARLHFEQIQRSLIYQNESLLFIYT